MAGAEKRVTATLSISRPLVDHLVAPTLSTPRFNGQDSTENVRLLMNYTVAM